MITEITTNSTIETINVGKALAPRLKKGDVLAFVGGLGMGKTAFTRGLAQGLGCGDIVSSPTFTIINEYRGTDINLCHMDAYRLKDSNELFETGFFEYIDSGWACAIEWSENVIDAITPRFIVTISLVSETGRKIIVEECE